jgi:hypothetical protein
VSGWIENPAVFTVSYRIDPITDAAKPLRNHWAPAAALLMARRTIRVAAANSSDRGQ